MKKIPVIAVKICSRCMYAAVLLILLHFCRRIFIAEKFIIPSYSMYPTLIPGDRILVSKLEYGARIYRSFDFSDHAALKCWRLPALGKIFPGDILVFNQVHPYGDWSKIEFKINSVFCKRVLGAPGDSIYIIDCINHNNHLSGIVGIEQAQRDLQNVPDSVLIQSNCFYAYPWTDGCSIKNLGPLYIPAKGDCVELNRFNCALYAKAVEYETGLKLVWLEGQAFLGNEPVRYYTFADDWFYTVGDNCTDSQDSRYWGLVPGRHVIGVAKTVLRCRDSATGALRSDRFLIKL